MQYPMDSYVCGIKQAQKVFSLVHFLLSCDKHVPVEFRYTYFTRKVNLAKRENFLNSNLYHKRRKALALHYQPFDAHPGAIVFNIQPDVEHWIVW